MRSLTQCVQRGIQRTEEKFGKAQTTPLNSELAELISRLNAKARRTEAIIKHVEKILKPFSDQKNEIYIYGSKRQNGKTVDKVNPHILLGRKLKALSESVGNKSVFEDVLSLAGNCQKELGQEELQFVEKSVDLLLNPLKEFLQSDLRSAAKEKANLLDKRLTLDAAKQQLQNSTNEKQFENGDMNVRSAQVEFDRQTDITRIIFEDLERSEFRYSRTILQFIDAQLDHYRERTHILERHKEIISRSLNLGKTSKKESFSITQSIDPENNILPEVDWNFVMAIVTEDYRAKKRNEINVKKNEIIKAYEVNPSNENPDVWLFVEKVNGRRGYVPATVLKAAPVAHEDN